MDGVRAAHRRFRAVAWSMAAGAAFDALFALAILLFREAAAARLGLTVPADPVYLQLNGVLLLLLAGLYVLPAVRPERYLGVVGVAAVGRLGGCLFLGLAWQAGRPTAFAWLALGDLVFGIWHAVLLLRVLAAGSRHATT